MAEEKVTETVGGIPELLVAADFMEDRGNTALAAKLRAAMVSSTAQQRGFGTDRFKSVVFLTRAERAHVRSGGLVFFLSSAMSGGSYGTYWRIAVDHGRYGIVPRVPDPVIVQFLG